MSNLFEEMRILGGDNLRNTVALIDTVSVGNIAKTVKDKAIGKIFNATNHLLSYVGDNRLTYSGKGELRDVVSEKAKEYKLMKDEQVLNVLKEKVIFKLSQVTDVDAGMSDDKLSVLLVDECARMFRVNDNLTPYEKIDRIFKIYDERYVKALYKIIGNEDAAKAKETNERIFTAISALPVDLRIRLKNTLCLKEFSQNALSRELRGERGKRIISHLIEFIGVDVFDNVKAVTNITYEGLTEFTRPERMILAYFVWKIEYTRGRGFYITDDCLPSYIKSSQKEREDKKEKAYFALCSEYGGVRSRLEALETGIKKNSVTYNDKIAKLNELYLKREDFKKDYDKVTSENDELKNKIEQTKAQIDNYADNASGMGNGAEFFKLREELSGYNRELKASNREKARLESAIREYFDAVKKLEEETKRLKDSMDMQTLERNGLNVKFKDLKKDYEYAVEFEHYKLKTRWLTCFMDIVFEENVIKNVVKDFNHEQILNIERALTELLEIKDIVAYGKDKLRKKEGNLETMTFVPSEGMVGHIVFCVATDSGKRAFVANITKN